MNDYDVIIVGAGPAGMTAAIYAKRSNLKVAMIEKGAPGGQINQTAHIENYPGISKIDGPSLSMQMFAQTQDLKIEYKYGNVLKIEDQESYKKITTDKEEILSKAVIITTGRRSRRLGFPNETKLAGRGVSWCAVCDGPLYKGKDVVVIGGGTAALEESLYLKDIVNSVTLIHRRDEFRADKELIEKVINEPKINIIYDTIAKDFNEENNKLESIQLENVKTKELKNLKTEIVFMYIGSVPVTNMVKEYNITDESKYIIADSNGRTNVLGIYAAGDVIKKDLYQIVNAAGEGATAAMSVVKDISN